MEVDKLYLEEEKQIRKSYETQLLSELLYLNYKFPQSMYYDNSINSIYNSINDTVIYTDEELKKIKNDAVLLAKEKYNLNIENFN